MNKYSDRICWLNVSQHQIFSDDFIKKNKNKVTISSIENYQNINEQFTENHQNEINWNFVSISQKLSPRFIKLFKSKLNIENIKKNKNIPKNFELSNILHTQIDLKSEIKNVKKFMDININFI
jgi:hypothetical protein